MVPLIVWSLVVVPLIDWNGVVVPLIGLFGVVVPLIVWLVVVNCPRLFALGFWSLRLICIGLP